MSSLLVRFNKLFYLCIIIALYVMITRCTKNVDDSYEPTPYVLNLPTYFPDMIIPEDNPLTVEGIELGRKLYYDVKLHPEQSKSCSSCHSQENSFTSASSNSLAHINLGFANKFLWNGKVEGTLEDIMLFEVEEFFGTNLNYLQYDAEYPFLFYKAFGTSRINTRLVAKALAQFFRVLTSSDSRYDQRMQGSYLFTPEEMDGYDIFFTERGDCFHCHGGALFTDNSFHNNGLDANPSAGRYTITQNPNDFGLYKTPTLRNIEFTAPYMHDGRFQTLEEVITFYSSGLNYSATIDPLMKQVGIGGVNLTPDEVQHLILFLKTLSDSSYIQNPALAYPH